MFFIDIDLFNMLYELNDVDFRIGYVLQVQG